MSKHQYYIVTKSNWQGDNWGGPVAGPMSKREAEAQKSRFEYHPQLGTGGIDIKAQRHAKVVSRSWLARNGGYPFTPRGRADLAWAICYAQEQGDV